MELYLEILENIRSFKSMKVCFMKNITPDIQKIFGANKIWSPCSWNVFSNIRETRVMKALYRVLKMFFCTQSYLVILFAMKFQKYPLFLIAIKDHLWFILLVGTLCFLAESHGAECYMVAQWMWFMSSSPPAARRKLKFSLLE